MSLEASGIDFGYSAPAPVLRSLTASFDPGALTAVIGPNGAGKSTLLRLLAGLLAPSAGRVTLGNQDVAGIPTPERARRIVYIPQASRVGFAFSAAAVVRMGLLTSGVGAGAACSDALARVGLQSSADTPFGNLSAGQQQRVTLARALAQFDLPAPPGAPRAVLADEPVSAMDPLHARRSLDTLRDLARAGASVVVVLHDLAAVLRHADRALMLGPSGTVAAAGPAADVLRPHLLEPVFGVPFREFSAGGRIVSLVPD